MQCPKCGYMLDAFEKECPRCAKLGTTTSQQQSVTPPTTPTPVTPRREPPERSNISVMRVIGGLLLIGGMLAVIYFFFIFDTSVEVPSTQILGETIGGGRVHNIGLMQDRQNGIIVAGIAAVVGILMMLFGGKRSLD